MVGSVDRRFRGAVRVASRIHTHPTSARNREIRKIRKIRKSGNPIWGAALRAALGEKISLARNFLLGEQGGPVVFSFAAAELRAELAPDTPETPSARAELGKCPETRSLKQGFRALSQFGS